MAKRATLRDIAAVVGVSAQTVSRVINGKPDVAEETRRQVWEVARQLGYRPNSVARSLVSRRTLSLGLVTWTVSDHFRAEVIMGAEREARSRGYVSILAVTDGNPEDVVVMCNLMLERQVDGILLLAPSVLPHQPIDCTLPLVSLAYPVDSAQAINVDVDNVDGGYQAVRHLTGLGHRHVGVVAGPRGWKATDDRTEGSRRALAEAGPGLDSSWIQSSSDWTLEAGYDAACALLDRHTDLTALFCQNDWLALGACRALGERGLSIPGDVSVVGYDDLPMCFFSSPSLTSVHQPSTGLGQLLAQLLIDAVEHGIAAKRDVLLKPELVPRESTASVRNPTRRGVRE
jgi:LacI family transcriptional regulator